MGRGDKDAAFGCRREVAIGRKCPCALTETAHRSEYLLIGAQLRQDVNVVATRESDPRYLIESALITPAPAPVEDRAEKRLHLLEGIGQFLFRYRAEMFIEQAMRVAAGERLFTLELAGKESVHQRVHLEHESARGIPLVRTAVLTQPRRRLLPALQGINFPM